MNRHQLAKEAPLSWHPDKGGKRGLICWDDDIEVSLGNDPSGERFTQISEKMLGGNYYPADAVVFDGEFRAQNRSLRVGDRVLQRAPVGPIGFYSAVEIFRIERDFTHCAIGYVTTRRHHGRGIWQAELRRDGDDLKLHVFSTASPNSWLFWLGLPIARHLQLRARRRAIEEFRNI